MSARPATKRGSIRGVLIAAFVLAVTGARADDRDDCQILSFAPLLLTIPACDRLIASGSLSEVDLFAMLTARAEAWRFALTYRAGVEIDRRDLLISRLADLDRALGLARRLRLKDKGGDPLRFALSGRGHAEAALGYDARALGDYSEAIALSDTPALLDLYGRSLAYERLGQLGQAIADMSAILRIHEHDSNFANHLVRRAELQEAAGDRAAARTDYRRALRENPDHSVAGKALKRLTPAD